jgi:2-polyprenyl-3-methyl-5-hydroxy-6-metoxy-1,4-benzoquinol methylase
VSPKLPCPCCATSEAETGDPCPVCGYRRCVAEPTVGPANSASFTKAHYATLTGRNALPARYLERKLADRIANLRTLLRADMRILEVGCAEGQLGACLKAEAKLHYTGIEPSRDAAAAAGVLDAVYVDSSALLPCADECRFDAILAFHVLEHIPDPATELARWANLVRPDGWLMIEVPHGGGHPDLARDLNAEHLHQFTTAALASLLQRSGFETMAVSRGHFESPVYTDSLRVLARPMVTDAARRERLIARFHRHLPGPFAVYGLGGDFRSYVQPVLGQLPVPALIDSDPQRAGQTVNGLKVENYSAARHRSLPILVCSLRHEESILAALQRAGHAAERIHLLADIFNSEPADA